MILEGVVSGSDAVAASRMCMALPLTVRVLRIDARHVTELDEPAAPVLRSLVRTWRHGREGYVDLRLDWRVLRSLSDQATSCVSDSRSLPVVTNERIVAAPEWVDGQAALTGQFL